MLDHDDDDLDAPVHDDVSLRFWGDAPQWPTGEVPAVPAPDRVRRPRVRVELEPRAPRTRRHHEISRRPGPALLGSVDPFLLRIGALVALAVLLVPVLLALRPASGPSMATAVGAPAIAPEPAAAAGVTDAPAVPAASPAVAPSASTAESPSATAAPTAASPVATSAPASPTQPTAPSTSSAPPGGVVDAAEADEPAERIEIPCQRTYTAAAGDYWLRLADASGVELADLLAVNDATTSTPIHPGDEICLPAGATVPSPPATAPPTAPPTTAPAQLVPTTTAPPATAPPTTAMPDVATVQEIIREVWPDELEERALEVARRESTFRPDARNWCCYGLFQIYWEVHRGWLDDLGVTSASQLYDARTNATAAYHLYLRSGGWGPWGG